MTPAKQGFLGGGRSSLRALFSFLECWEVEVEASRCFPTVNLLPMDPISLMSQGDTSTLGYPHLGTQQFHCGSRTVCKILFLL